MGEKFELERFEWQAPDRLEIAGTFHGLEQSPDDTPVLVVSGDGEAHQLRSVDASLSGPPEDGKSWQAQVAGGEGPVGGGDGEAHQLRSVDASLSGPPEDGKSWQAQFEWDEAPVGIEAAALEFGTGMVIDLPAPGASRGRARYIEVRRD